MKTSKLFLLFILSVLWLPLGARVVQTYHVTEPGSLATMMGESWTGIDSLVVTGDINADDVATMRRCVYEGVTTGVNLMDANMPDDALPDSAFIAGFVIDEHGKAHQDYRLQYVTLPRSLRSIGNLAFAYSGLRAIELPLSLTAIGSRAFYACRMLGGEVCVPEGVTSLIGTFAQCERVQRVQVLSPECRLAGAFANMYSLRQVDMAGGVCNITGDNTFYNCRRLAGEVVMPTTMPSIPSGTFMMCSSLRKVTLPERVQMCMPNAFDYSGLEEVVWPSTMSMQGIRQFTFRHCRFKRFVANYWMSNVTQENFGGNYQLEQLAVDKNVRLKGGALARCNKLCEVYCVSDVVPAIYGEGSPFPDKAADAVLYVPRGAKAAYEAAQYWNTFSRIEELDEFPEWVSSNSHYLRGSMQ